MIVVLRRALQAVEEANLWNIRKEAPIQRVALRACKTVEEANRKWQRLEALAGKAGTRTSVLTDR